MKWFSVIFTFLFSFLLSAWANAADVIAQPTYLNGILGWIAGVGPGATAGVAAVIEILLRLIPSVKPLSLLIPIKYLLDGVVAIFKFLSDFLGALINSLNAVQPPTP